MKALQLQNESYLSEYKHLQGSEGSLPYRVGPAPECALLHRIDWDYFLTLTHKPDRMLTTKVNGEEQKIGRWWEPLSWSRQKSRFCSWERKTRRKLKIDETNFRWVRRWEQGRGGRDHFHLLINFHNRRLVNNSTFHFLSGVWSGLEFGHATNRKCKTTGVQPYITKVQNEYEMNRFGSDRFRSVEFSKGALKSLRRSAKCAA
jgi:hypothetical protein